MIYAFRPHIHIQSCCCGKVNFSRHVSAFTTHMRSTFCRVITSAFRAPQLNLVPPVYRGDKGLRRSGVEVIRLVVDGIEGHRSGNASIVREACAGAVRTGIPFHKVIIGLGGR